MSAVPRSSQHPEHGVGTGRHAFIFDADAELYARPPSPLQRATVVVVGDKDVKDAVEPLDFHRIFQNDATRDGMDTWTRYKFKYSDKCLLTTLLLTRSLKMEHDS